METLIEYFSNMPSLHRTILLVSGLMLFSFIESVFPFLERSYGVGKHAITNLFFTLTTAVVNLPLAFLIVLSCDYVVDNSFGLLQWLGGSPILMITLGLLLMDLVGAWLIHYLEHHVKWMWKFHAVHHTDQHLDTTSGNRHHPGESVFRLVFTILAIWILGAPIWLVFVYQTLSVILTQFNHSNVIIPKQVDNILRKFIVTPNMHQVHHHYRMPYSDSNYGNIFPYWDLMFNTYKRADNDKIKYGLDTHMEPEFSNKIGAMLKMPFLPYRDKIMYGEEENLGE